MIKLFIYLEKQAKNRSWTTMAAIVVEPIEIAVMEIVETTVTEAVESTVEVSIESAVEGAVESGIEEAIKDVIRDASEADLYKVLGSAVEDSIKNLTKSLGKISESAENAVNDAVRQLTEKTISSVQSCLEKDIDLMLATLSGATMTVLKTLTKQVEKPQREQNEQDQCKILKKIKSFGENVNFTLFFAKESGKISYVDVVRDEELIKLLADPFAGVVASKLLSKFTNQTKENLKATDGIDDSNSQILSSSSTQMVCFRSQCSFVAFPARDVYNVDGSSRDKRAGTAWINFWEWFFEQTFNRLCTRNCFIASPPRDVKGIVGGHLELAVRDNMWYMLPICKAHNSKIYDRGGDGGVMKTSIDAWAIRMPVYGDISSKSVAEEFQQMNISSKFQPMNMSNEDVAKKSYKILNNFLGSTTKTILSTMIKSMFDNIQKALKEAGADTKTFTKDTGAHIRNVSLIPVYGWIRGPILLSKMKKKCIRHFHSVAAKKISLAVTSFRWDESAVTEAAKKTSASKEWRDALSNLGELVVKSGTTVQK